MQQRSKIRLNLVAMPLFYQHNIDAHSRLAVWRIEEQESFFVEHIGMQKQIAHPYKRLQHLAGRYLLSVMQPGFPLASIEIDPSNRPFLSDGRFQFSISHCGNYAAAIVSNNRCVGIDIELETPRMKAIAQRFLHSDEHQLLDEWEAFPQLHLQLITMIWSAKEAIFKWYGRGNVSFSQHIRLDGPIVAHAAGEYILPFVFRKEGEKHLHVHARIFDPLVLVWLAD
jgi:4'-phosphopantetheinyl transferase EntD